MSDAAVLVADLASMEAAQRRKLEDRVRQLEADVDLLRKQVAALAKWAMEAEEEASNGD